MARKKLLTWAGRSKFEYSGSVKSGTDIYYGKDFRYHELISSDKYQMLLDHFRSRTVSIGTSRTNPPNKSLGEWLKANVSRTALASYVGPILIHEEHAKRIDTQSDMIKF
jgi:hypothetical protein